MIEVKDEKCEHEAMYPILVSRDQKFIFCQCDDCDRIFWQNTEVTKLLEI